ncbi:hypothetical protein SBOR_4560 [Sclerotinia borealis F-4128]|uniref:Uncharacterized protein n=1 Tax=Sclerotinia borealis (strain F-4128) TaxID=1432307 RepID=W9CE38_SCLBF|nr:hypothetical protein SBOR_4560 [Sclerotinia borealis F-4128]
MCCFDGCSKGDHIAPVKKIQPSEVKEVEKRHKDQHNRSPVPSDLNYRGRSRSTGNNSPQSGDRQSPRDSRSHNGEPAQRVHAQQQSHRAPAQSQLDNNNHRR